MEINWATENMYFLQFHEVVEKLVGHVKRHKVDKAINGSVLENDVKRKNYCQPSTVKYLLFKLLQEGHKNHTHYSCPPDRN